MLVFLLPPALLDVPHNTHPALLLLNTALDSSVIAAMLLRSWSRLRWLLPGLATLASALHAIREYLKPGGGSHLVLWIEVPFCMICGLVAIEEAIRTPKSAEGPAPTEE